MISNLDMRFRGNPDIDELELASDSSDDFEEAQ
jgi:hypothetical protein